MDVYLSNEPEITIEIEVPESVIKYNNTEYIDIKYFVGKAHGYSGRLWEYLESELNKIGFKGNISEIIYNTDYNSYVTVVIIYKFDIFKDNDLNMLIKFIKNYKTSTN